MKTIIVNLSVLIFISISISSCGGENNSNSKSSSNIAVDVVVERGSLLNSIVTDSSNPIQTAKQKDNTNTYTFPSEPIYPIKAKGGVIDIDGNGLDEGDVAFLGELNSYSLVITPATTYVGNPNTTKGKERLKRLKDSSGIQNDEDILNKVPTTVSKEAIALANAIYENYYENFDGDDSTNVDFNDSNLSINLDVKFNKYKTIINNRSDLVTLSQISKLAEEQLVDDLNISKIQANELSDYAKPSDIPKILTLIPSDDIIEDQLADAILRVQEAIALITITENKFYMGSDSNWKLDFYNVVKSYEQAITYLNQLILVHEQMESELSNASFSKKLVKKTCNYEVDPYCISDAEHRKIDFYIEHYGKTTPKGNLIDLKLIAKKTKLNIESIYSEIKDKYGRIYAKETRLSAINETAENIASNISHAGDISSAVLGIKGGVTVLKEGIKYGLKRKAQTTLFKEQLTRPSGMSLNVYDTLRAKYFSKWSKESGELLVKARQGIIEGSWDLSSNIVSLYNKGSHLGVFEKSESLSSVGSIMDISNLGLNLVKISKTALTDSGMKKIFVLSKEGSSKKDIVFISDSLASEIAYNNYGDLVSLSKFSIGFIYDSNGNIKTWNENIFNEEIDFIKDLLSKQSPEEVFPKGEYKYFDEDDNITVSTTSKVIDFKYIENEYHKNIIDNSLNEYLNDDTDKDGVIDFNDICPDNYGLGSSGEPICSVSEVLNNCSCTSTLTPLSNDYYIDTCRNEIEFIYHSNGEVKYEFCRYDMAGLNPANSIYPHFSNNIVGALKEYYIDGTLKLKQNYALVLNENAKAKNLQISDDERFNEDGLLTYKVNLVLLKNNDNSWVSLTREGKLEEYSISVDKTKSYLRAEYTKINKKNSLGINTSYLHGPLKAYYEDGTLKTQGTYSNNIRVGVWTGYFGKPTANGFDGYAFWPYEMSISEYDNNGLQVKSETCAIYLYDSKGNPTIEAIYLSEINGKAHEHICK